MACTRFLCQNVEDRQSTNALVVAERSAGVASPGPRLWVGPARDDVQTFRGEIGAFGERRPAAVVGDEGHAIERPHQVSLEVASEEEQRRRRMVEGVGEADHVELPDETSATDVAHERELAGVQHLVRAVDHVGGHRRSDERPLRPPSRPAEQLVDGDDIGRVASMTLELGRDPRRASG